MAGHSQPLLPHPASRIQALEPLGVFTACGLACSGQQGGAEFLKQSKTSSLSNASRNAVIPSSSVKGRQHFRLLTGGCIQKSSPFSSASHNVENRIISSAGGTRQTEEDDIMKEILVLVNDSLELRGVVSVANRGIGPDMRDRVNRLYERVSLLKQSAERAAKSSGRVSAQLIATFKGLQREHSSLENIVRLATEAGPVLFECEGSQPSDLNIAEKGISFLKEVDNWPLKDEPPNPEPLQRIKRESAIEAADTPKYVMTTTASEGSSPLAAFRAEIERRVTEQLVAKQVGQATTSIKAITEISTILKTEDQHRQALKKQLQKVEIASKGDPNTVFTGQLMSVREEGKSGTENLLCEKDPFLRIVEAEQTARLAETDAALKSLEVERLKSQLGDLEEEVRDLKQVATRANIAEAEVRRLEMEIAKNIPLEVHKQVVGRVRSALLEARARVSQITRSHAMLLLRAREKEAMLAAVKGELLAEQQMLLEKVKELTVEVSGRVTIEEMKDAISNTVTEIEQELKKAQEKAVTLSLELEKKETMILQLQEEWDGERKGLQSEIANIKDRLATVQKEQEDFDPEELQSELANAKDRLAIMQEERKYEQAQFSEAQQKVRLLEDQIAQLTQKVNDAEAHRELQRQALLDNVRTLVTEMMKVSRVKLANESKDAENVLGLEPSFARVGQEIANHQGLLLSDERAASLEFFFAIMGQLIRQEIQRMSAASANNQHQSNGQSSEVIRKQPNSETLWDDLREIKDMSKDGQDRESLQVQRTVTLLYESSWERAFVHYTADSTGWTNVPGVLMQNANGWKGKPLKVLTIPASTLEFVLTDGEGNWDRHPGGGNYVIRESGSFLLSAGVLQAASAG